jgi:hypothetical protein
MKLHEKKSVDYENEVKYADSVQNKIVSRLQKAEDQQRTWI